MLKFVCICISACIMYLVNFKLQLSFVIVHILILLQLAFSDPYKYYRKENSNHIPISNDFSSVEEYEQFSRQNPLSPKNLVQSALKENAIYFILNDYSIQLRKRLQLLERYIDDYEESSLKGTEHVPHSNTMAIEKAQLVAYHPFMAYRMVRRFNRDLPNILFDLVKDLEKQTLNDISNIVEDHRWPEDENVNHLMQGILNIQKVQDADTIQFSAGKLDALMPKFKRPIGLNVEQTFEIAEFAFGQGLIALAVEWMSAAEKKIDNDITNDMSPFAVERWKIEENLNLYAEIHDDLWDFDSMSSKRFRGSNKRTNPDLFENKISSKAELIKRETVDFKMYKGNLKNENLTWINFMGLCQGENYQHPRWIVPNLKCYYDHKLHPYFVLGPLKIEVLQKQPQVIKVHEFIKGFHKDKPIEFSELVDRERQVLKLLEYLTELSTYGANISYAIKGFGDFEMLEEKESKTTGDVFIIQLNSESDLIGGEIAFPMLGFLSRPDKGSIVIRKNLLDKNGIRDPRNFYRNCPVVYGYQSEMIIKVP